MRRQAVIILALLIVCGVSTAARHFALVKSAPAAGAKLEVSPEKIQLWFSQLPAAGVSQLKLGLAADEKSEIAIGKTTIDAGERSMTAALSKPLAPGAYVIRWRGAGDDGHVMSGQVPFTIAPYSTR
ncbi:MAG TPA: copper resistance CopC family protein [Vicinamibacterales bacterium]|nr:copper resistance CopC family protein [Vicinamibacterales bacterium]